MQKGKFIKNIDCCICDVKNEKTSIVTIISDDGDLETSYILAKLALKYGIKITIASPVDNIIKNLTHWQLLEANFPIEIANHSWNHLRIDDDSKVDISEIRHQYLDSAAFFAKNFHSPNFSFIPPENQLTKNAFKVLREGQFLAARSWHRGRNTLDPADGTEPGQWLNLKCRGIGDNDFDIRRELDQMHADPSWLIEMWHNVYTTNKVSYQPIHVDLAEEHIQILKNDSSIWIAGFGEAISYLWQKKNVELVSFFYRDILHIKLEKKNKNLPWNKFISPISVRIKKENFPHPFTACEIVKGIENFVLDENTGDIIVNIMPGAHGHLRIIP
ncbi:MAG: polysaccharide deacetylase family protein [Desulfovibrionaceae bacterium]|nr:polysaccharide deacetylase family protein [Desulfovibrionaceae bacterium]